MSFSIRTDYRVVCGPLLAVKFKPHEDVGMATLLITFLLF